MIEKSAQADKRHLLPTGSKRLHGAGVPELAPPHYVAAHRPCSTPCVAYVGRGAGPDAGVVLRARDWLQRPADSLVWRRPDARSRVDLRCPDCGERVGFSSATLRPLGGDLPLGEQRELAFAIFAKLEAA